MKIIEQSQVRIHCDRVDCVPQNIEIVFEPAIDKRSTILARNRDTDAVVGLSVWPTECLRDRSWWQSCLSARWIRPRLRTTFPDWKTNGPTRRESNCWQYRKMSAWSSDSPRVQWMWPFRTSAIRWPRAFSGEVSFNTKTKKNDRLN